MKFWILADKKDRKALEKLGVVLGEYNADNKEWRGCSLDNADFDAFEANWGRWYWGPQEV